MELKRILARDTRSANEKARQRYGEDVLVISTQRVGDQTELIVAIDADASAAADPQVAPAASTAVSSSQAEKDEVFAEIFGFVQRQEQIVPQAPTASPMSTVAIPDDAAIKAPAVQSVRRTERATQLPPKPTQPRRPTKSKFSPEPGGEWTNLLQQELARSREIVDLLRQEVGVLRREFSLARQTLPWEASLTLPSDVRALVDQMTAMGVPTGLRTLLTDAMSHSENAVQALAAMREALESHLQGCHGEPMQKGVHALIGPSGAGKTSMSVRLAQMQSAQHGIEQQAIISFADKRPGAWSQLQTLAASVGVEVFRATDPDALDVLLSELASAKTHIWIDTPAHACFEVANALLQSRTPIHFHAVAPVDASVATMQRLQASPTTWSSVVLTKADESDVVWHWIQALSAKPLPISCVAHSDRVGVAADPFHAQEWVDRALSVLDVVPKATAKPSKAKAPARKRRPTAEKVVHG